MARQMKGISWQGIDVSLGDWGMPLALQSCDVPENYMINPKPTYSVLELLSCLTLLVI